MVFGRCTIFAIIIAILCACSLWKKRHQICGGSPRPHSQSGDSAGSCYAPPQYSRCSSFHHAPPPYTEVCQISINKLLRNFYLKNAKIVSLMIFIFFFCVALFSSLFFFSSICVWFCHIDFRLQRNQIYIHWYFPVTILIMVKTVPAT